ncbi:hypothetical protein GCM10023158_24560 [Gluconacetobacter tumulicola]
MVGGGHTDRRIDIGAVQFATAALQALIEAGQRRLGDFHAVVVAIEGDAIAAAGQADAESTFEMKQVTVVITDELCQQGIVVELQRDRPHRGDVGRGLMIARPGRAPAGQDR